MVDIAHVTKRPHPHKILWYRYIPHTIAALILSASVGGCGTPAKTSISVPTSHATTHGHGKSRKHHPKHMRQGAPMIISQVTSSIIRLSQGTNHINVSARVPTYATGGYALSQKGWLRVGAVVKLVHQGKKVSALELIPLAQGTISNITGQTVVVTTKTGPLTMPNGTTIPTLGISTITTGTKVMLFGTSKTSILGMAGIPTTHRLVMVAANSAADTITVETGIGTTITVPFDGSLHQLQHLGLGHHVQVYQAPNGKWISAR